MCTTTVNSLLVGAAVARRYEIGVRLALGASRWRVVRQLLTEITILAAAGGALGVWMSSAILRVTEVAQDGLDVSPNWATMAFTMSYALLAATLCGLSPALHATRTGLADVRKTAGRRALVDLGFRRRSSSRGEIAIAQPLMVLLAAVIASVLGQIPAASEGTVRDHVLITELDTVCRLQSEVTRQDPFPGAAIGAISGSDCGPFGGLAQGWLSLEPPMSSAQATAQPAVRGDGFAVPPRLPGRRRPDHSWSRVRRERYRAPANRRDAVDPLRVAGGTIVQVREPRSGATVWRLAVNQRRAGERPNEYEVVGVVRMASETNSLEYPSELPPVFVPYRRQREGRILIRTAGPAEPLIPTVTAIVREDAE